MALNRVETNALRELVEAAADAVSAMQISGVQMGLGEFYQGKYEPKKGEFASEFNQRLARLRSSSAIAGSLLRSQEGL